MPGEAEEQEIPKKNQPTDHGHPAAGSVRGTCSKAEDTPDAGKPTGSETVTSADPENVVMPPVDETVTPLRQTSPCPMAWYPDPRRMDFQKVIMLDRPEVIMDVGNDSPDGGVDNQMVDHRESTRPVQTRRKLA